MKWKAKKELEIGDMRTKCKFLLFPKNINGEVRWLEKATYTQKYETVYGSGYMWYKWEDKEWVKN